MAGGEWCYVNGSVVSMRIWRAVCIVFDVFFSLCCGIRSWFSGTV